MSPPPRTVRIAPSILAADFGHLADEVAAVEAAGADWIHVDVMDGHFVPNITLGPSITEAVGRSTSLPLDVHLMIEKPERYVEAFVGASAATVGIHAETCPHPATPIQAVEHVLGDIDQVLLMTVNPGFGGQKFIPSVLPKIRALRDAIDDQGLEVDLEVDGGIGPETIGRAAEAGANVFVAGTSIFGAPDYAQAIAALRTGAGAT